VKTGICASSLAACLLLGRGAFAADETGKAAEGAAPKAASEAKPSSAEEAKPSSAEAEDSADQGPKQYADEKFGHRFQFGLRTGIVGGYRMIFRYDKSPFCHTPKGIADKDEQKFCGNVAPMALDVAASFAVVDFAEPYLWARFGLGGEASTNTQALKAFGVGARIYTMSDSKLKVFVEPAVGLEVEGGAGNPQWAFDNGATPEYKKDVLFHLAVGPQYDFARAFGAYFNAGMTTGVLRYIHTELELSLGVQVRVP
jgi:hypothetical protein